MSRYIAEATARRLADDERAELRALLKEQYTERSTLDLELAQEFAHAEEEVES
jgi:hypothetical protein